MSPTQGTSRSASPLAGRMLRVVMWLVCAVSVAPAAADPSVVAGAAAADYPTLHTSEIGYETSGPKRAFIEMLASVSGLPDGSRFDVRNLAGQTVLSGVPAAKQTKWGRDFWLIDFSSVTKPGRYQLTVAFGTFILASSSFVIGDTPLLDTQLYQIAVNQLNERYPSPMASTAPYFGGYLPSNRTTKDDVVYSNSPDTVAYPYREPQPGDYVPKIWRDCSSNYTEVESAGVTVLALIDLYSKVVRTSNRFDAQQRNQLIVNLQRGVDYLVSLEEHHPGDPLRDGRFRHSTLVNVFDGAWWAGNVHNWHDTAFGAWVLARGAEKLREIAGETTDEEIRHSLGASATAALTAAKSAWRNADFRPYYLAEDLDTSGIPGYDYKGDLWPWTAWRRLARAMYAVTDATWDMGALLQKEKGYAGLRSRELIAFLNASTSLYRVSDEQALSKNRYLTTAKRVAAELMRRQYVAVDQPLDGVYGMFHEFGVDSGAARNAFLLESAQAGLSLLGHYEFTSLSGFIDLLTLLPDDPDAARWDRAVRSWAIGYELAAASRNPLGIAPATVYPSPNGTTGPAAVYWFGNHLHGGAEIPGQAAHSLMEIGNYLNDASFYAPAVNDVQFYAGVNAGIGLTHQPSTLIKGVGAKTMVGPYMETSAPIGSIANGYHATNSFSPAVYETFDNNKTLPPDGLGDGATTGQESWILHSHSYVLGAVSVEAPFRLRVRAASSGVALPGLKLNVEYPRSPSLPSQSFTTGPDGSISIATATLGQDAIVRLIRPGFPDYIEKVATLGGGTYSWYVDYRDYFSVAATGLPPRLAADTRYHVKISVRDLGETSQPVKLTFRYAGLDGGLLTTTLPPLVVKENMARRREFELTTTSGGADQPYELRIHASTPSNSRIVQLTGTVGP